MREIDIEECHQILLQIATAVDEICTKYEIPYYMICGTMLGAVRHGGFIPWDDDFDIAIDRAYYDLFLEKAKSELPDNLRLSTYQNSDGIFFGFAKVQDIRTVAVEPTYYLLKEDNRNGINVDIFPLDSCSENPKGYSVIRGLFRVQRFLFVNSTHPSKVNGFFRSVVRAVCPFDKNYLLKKIDSYIRRFEDKSGDFYISYWSLYGKKSICEKRLFGTPQKYKFESQSFLGPQKSDEYLTQVFGDYMKLPPVEKRRVHCNNLYWK